ncbi:MAG: hypothetical protein ACD_28C00284G0005 [uncultured bacterium]|nr:MAG: hypothetical protein ACD_28C00284G0005 [uncultured bacterium]
MIKIHSKKEDYLQEFRSKIFVVKIGGEVIAQSQTLETILVDIQELLKEGIQIILVHGGGPQADEISKQWGHTPQKKEGRRITTQRDLDVIKMLYGGTLNLDILSLLKKIGGKGMRVSGLDGDLFEVKLRDKTEFDYGYVGDIVQVDASILHRVLEAGCLPVVSPLGVTEEGTIVNINADTIAMELAVALKAEKLIFFTNREGIYHHHRLCRTLTTEKADTLIAKKVIVGGMKVKVENGLKALQDGVQKVHIINGLSPHSLLKEVLTQKGVGTMLI